MYFLAKYTDLFFNKLNGKVHGKEKKEALVQRKINTEANKNKKTSIYVTFDILIYAYICF